MRKWILSALALWAWRWFTRPKARPARAPANANRRAADARRAGLRR